MRPETRWLPVALCLTVAPLAELGAQDVEIIARVRGRELPRGYYEAVRENPGLFEVRGGWIARAERGAAAGVPVSGELPLVNVLALFADSPEPHVDEGDLERVLYSGPAPDGTLREYYSEVSGGRFTIGGAVAPWVRTSVTLAEAVGDSYGLGGDNRMGDYLVEALTLADANIDFGLFDNDGPDNVPNSGDDNGVVDALAFYFLEVEASCGGPGVWPHFSGITPRTGSDFVTDDKRPDGTHIRIDPYFIQSIVDCAGTDIAPIATIAHEMGHLIGLPDLYHPVDGILPHQRRWVVGCWSLMAAGAWGCGDSDPELWTRPTHLGAWEKQRLGWLDEIQQITGVEVQELELPAVQTDRRILEVPVGEDERLLIEFRKRLSFDLNLPSEGVLIYRINDTIPFRPCTHCPPLYRVMLMEADGNNTLTRTPEDGGNRGEPGDAYGVTGPGAFTNVTDPSTRLNAGLGEPSHVNVLRVTVEEGRAHLVISTTPFSLERLLGPLLLDGGDAVTASERQYLDESNNRNGRYDVGDLRAYLLGLGPDVVTSRATADSRQLGRSTGGRPR